MLLAVTGLRREARIAESEHVRTVCGGGHRDSLEAQLARALQQPIQAIISFGVAGALAHKLVAGDLIVAPRIIDGRDVYPCDPRWLKAITSQIPNALVVAMAGTSSVLASPSGKAAFYRETGAAAVDMESHIAAKIARDRRLPFIAIRAISDPYDRALPSAALTALKPDGRMDSWAITRSLLSEPQQIPDLFRTARESDRAFAALLRCRRALGSVFALPDFR